MKLQQTIPFVLFLLLPFLNVRAQEQTQPSEKPDYFIEGGLRYGFALYHPESFVYLENFWFNTYEVRLGLQTHGRNAWERPLGNPILGIALRYTDYTDFSDSPELRRQQRDTLGKNVAVFGYVQAPIVRWGFFTWHYQIGLGVAACTKTNELLSLHVNPYINLQSGFDFRLSPRIDLALNANFTHSSNASLNFPNWGINEVQGIASVRYHFNNSENPKIKMDLLEKFEPYNALFVTVDPGWLWARYNNYYYLKTGISAGYERHLFPILKVGAALEFHLSNRLMPTREYKPVYDDGTSYEAPKVLFSSAVFAFGDITFGRFAFSVGAGAYLFRTPSNFDLAQTGAYSGTLDKMPWFYEKVGLKVSLGKKQNHFVGASIRAHFPVADYLAFTYGYRFWKF
ncbi:MAG: acyloxyacyl hydrolase [Prevotellaceae bacterium]|jgi:hypothetical protein|nr:acyloxyacyl hydrolase [Prevotellaceae bacterium]